MKMQMGKQRKSRFEVQVDVGSPHGDLYEFEQTTYYRVVDTHSNKVVLTLRGEMEANQITTTGMGDDYCFSGVCEVTIARDGMSVNVRYHDSREEMVPISNS